MKTDKQQSGGGKPNSVVFGFVQLDRTFHELSPQDRNGDELDLSEAFHVRGRLTWPDLLKNYRTVILSEAGSGKTEEIRQTAQRLHAEGKAAFFLRLEHVSNDLDDAFEVGSLEEFETWLKSENEAWLFLDSVDEARLKSPADFALAVRKLGSRVKLAAQRAHIVITGRTHAWRAKSDADLCAAHFPYGAPVQTISQDPEADVALDDIAGQVRTQTQNRDEPVFKIIALDDLGRDQIEKFARARGIFDTKTLLSDLERADAWSFTARPQDLQELIGFWLEKGRIGTLLEIMTASIDRRLVERSQDRADANPLSVDKARRGVRLAAAATTLAHNPIIQVPDGAENKKGIPLQDVLGDWDGRDRSTLLSFPIFDEAIYATVRFHHRSVREYLTAEWLAKLLKSSVSRRAVESILFHNQYGMDVVIPTMRPVLPWLAILDDRVRERLRKVSPEVLFEGGDPSSLPLQTRREILAEVCEQIASGMAGLGATSYSAVQRFANHDITNDIRDLLKKYSSNDELRGFLARMIWLGGLRDLLPEAADIAFSSKSSRYTRIAAFRAVTELGDTQTVERLRKHFSEESDELDREWLAELISDNDPTPETCGWLLTCLAKAKPKERHSIDKLAHVAADFMRKVDIASVPVLMRGLSKLLEEEPFIERAFCHVSKRHAWLLSAAAAAAQRVIEERHAFALNEVALRILFNLRIGKEWRSELRDNTPQFPELFRSWPDLNRTAFWYDVRALRQRMLRPGDRLTYFGQAAVFGAFWSFDSNDFDYACEQIDVQPEQDDKFVALSLAFDLYVKAGRKLDWRRTLKRAVAADDELKQRLATLLRPPAQSDPYRKETQKWKRQAAARRRREKENYEKSKEYLLKNVCDIREPKVSDPTNISNAQWYLHERLREKEDGLNKWTGGHWVDLVPEYGREVAHAYRDAVVAYWRKYTPALRSEGAPPNSVPIMVIFGLTGLGIEAAETPDWPVALKDGEVILACRYACHELNGFPSWFPKLFVARPKLATECLMREIAYELSAETAEQETHYVLSDVSWSGQWAWHELGPQIYRLLEEVNPRNSATLGKLLKIVEGSEVDDANLAVLAARKVADPASTHVPLWYAVWVGVDPDKAVPALTSYLSALPDGAARTHSAMQFVTRLFGSRRSETIARSRFQTAEHLKTLYLLMHQYIRKSDDIQRAGKGAYSPELRDDAQEARNKLFDALNKLSGKAAFMAMREIAQNHPDEGSKGWLMRLTRQKAEQDSDLTPWTPSQVRDFNDKLDRTPKSHRELAEVAVLRLLDLKEDLENGDTSVAAILQKVTQETEMRNYIAHELSEKSFGRYSIPQEDELADAKRPDLRFVGIGFQGPVPTELKLADANWSGPSLFERLENQLAGDYLRDIHSGRGVFTLVNRGKKQSWQHPETGEALDFDQLVAALQAHWLKISPNFPNVDDITVIGIDLTKRFRSPSSSGSTQKS